MGFRSVFSTPGAAFQGEGTVKPAYNRIMGTPLDIAALLTLLHSGETVLVPTDLAARRLRWSFDRHQRNLGLRAWEPPRVQSWAEWTRSLWSSALVDGIDDRVLLNPLQEQALWSE